jgi:hypothetical protein
MDFYAALQAVERIDIGIRELIAAQALQTEKQQMTNQLLLGILRELKKEGSDNND